jgi:hypothetical protein
MFLIVSKYLVPKGYGGITVFPFVFFRSKYHAGDVVSVNHEKIHLRQQAELLVVLFFIWYGLEFLVRFAKHRNWNNAYHSISFEREAYANESNLVYLKQRRFWRFLNYL